MCGIAGWLGRLPDAESYSARVLDALRHRGPDGCGAKFFGDATLLHTRLSVIDLSSAGAQPMANEDGTVWVVCNGEIYNHQELREWLKRRGHLFKSRSDTEVLPHLYEELGDGFASKLRGMFALAIYDLRTRRLLVARDRFGIKPLFYAPTKSWFGFASELGALVGLPEIDITPDRQAIYDFAALFYIPAPETFYAGIRAIRPGEMIEAELDENKIAWTARAYHQWSIAPNPAISFDQAAEQADALLSRAVRRQMESDVPLGCLLSGGIDSALVSAAAQAASAGNLRTFNVRFSDEEYDETWAALAVARHIGSRHETLDMDRVAGTWEHITDLLLHAGQPFADTSLFAVNAICRVMRRQVTVGLSGDGGDEGFSGYDLYWQLERIARCQILPTFIGPWLAAGLAPFASLGVISRRLPRRLEDLAGADDTAILQGLFCWLPERDHRRLCRHTDLLPVRRFFEPQWERHLPWPSSRLENLAAKATEVNARLTLPNDFLFKVDAASMRESLEIRVPMLDEDLFEFGLSLPHKLKVKARTCKLVLRRVAERRLPEAVAKKPKRGFAIPIDSWADQNFKSSLKDLVLGPSSRLPEYFDPQVYRPAVLAFCEGRPFPSFSRGLLYQFGIMLLSVELLTAHAPGAQRHGVEWNTKVSQALHDGANVVLPGSRALSLP